MVLSFIDSPFTSKVEYEAYARGEVALPDVGGVTQAMEGASLAASSAWGPLEYPPARRAALKAQFDVETKTSANGRLILKACHKLIFNAEERKEYAFDNFDEDLQATSAGGCKHDMSWDDIVKFMEDNL